MNTWQVDVFTITINFKIPKKDHVKENIKLLKITKHDLKDREASDGNQTYCDDHLTVYTNIESLRCIPETNTLFCISFRPQYV